MLALLTSDPTAAPLEALHEGVLEDARRLRSIQVRLARRLLALRRAPSLYRFGATTFSLYCESIGLSAAEGRDLASLAEAEQVRPDVVPRFAEGRLSLGKVSALAYLLRLPPRDPPLPPCGTTPGERPVPPDSRSSPLGSATEGTDEDWVRRAEGVTTRDLWRLLEERREEQRLRETPEFVAMFVSRRGREDFVRCRELVSRREWIPVTEGATLERVCDTYLVRNDPERRAARLAEKDRNPARVRTSGAGAPGNGKSGDGTSGGGKPGDRASGAVSSTRIVPIPGEDTGSRRRRIPVAMQRALVRLFGDRCWVEGCDRRCFLHFAHGVPVRVGGEDDPDNLLRLCREHHAQFDGDGWRPVLRQDGVVVLLDRRGVAVGRLRGKHVRGTDERGREAPGVDDRDRDNRGTADRGTADRGTEAGGTIE